MAAKISIGRFRRYLCFGIKFRLLLPLIIIYAFAILSLKEQILNSVSNTFTTFHLPDRDENVVRRELRLVHVLFRHGHRSPFKIYPNDPIPASIWREGLGQLTMLGRVQHYKVGEYLRDYYDGYLKQKPQEVHCLSSGAKRCLYGAYALLAAMYPPPKDKRIHENLNWQPIPVEYRPESEDKYLQSILHCPKSDREKDAEFVRPEGAKYIRKNRHLYEYWSEKSGMNITDYDKAGSLYKTLLVQRALNLSIPEWALSTWEALHENGDMGYYFNFRSKIQHRLRAGPCIGRILNEMRLKINNPKHVKSIYLYSGHGSNVAVILQALRMYNMKMPPYTSFVTFELYSEGPHHSIRFLYTNTTTPENHIPPPNILILPGCTEYCPFEFVVQYTKHLIPENWEEECESGKH